ncbi:MAG: hypothetical protein MHMPM18_000605 [Marteilia pararefringens]
MITFILEIAIPSMIVIVYYQEPNLFMITRVSEKKLMLSIFSDIYMICIIYLCVSSFLNLYIMVKLHSNRKTENNYMKNCGTFDKSRPIRSRTDTVEQNTEIEGNNDGGEEKFLIVEDGLYRFKI